MAFPEQPSLDERGRREGVAGLYRECHRRSELLALGRRTVPVEGLLRVALARFGRPAVVVADRWWESELRDALEAAKIPPAAFASRGMGYFDGGEDVRAFRRACADGRMTPAPSLFLRSAMAEALTVSDPRGNARLAKGSQGGRRLRARDDAACAALLAVGEGAPPVLAAALGAEAFTLRARRIASLREKTVHRERSAPWSSLSSELGAWRHNPRGERGRGRTMLECRAP